MSHVYLDWLGGGGGSGRVAFTWTTVETTRAKSCLPFALPPPPPPPPQPSSSSVREVDDSHLFFPPDSRVFAVPLIHPRDQPCNSVIHQQDPILFALLCCLRNKSVCLKVECVEILDNLHILISFGCLYFVALSWIFITWLFSVEQYTLLINPHWLKEMRTTFSLLCIFTRLFNGINFF